MTTLLLYIFIIGCIIYYSETTKKSGFRGGLLSLKEKIAIGVGVSFVLSGLIAFGVLINSDDKQEQVMLKEVNPGNSDKQEQVMLKEVNPGNSDIGQCLCSSSSRYTDTYRHTDTCRYTDTHRHTYRYTDTHGYTL
jgi:hypothetical protein